MSNTQPDKGHKPKSLQQLRKMYDEIGNLDRDKKLLWARKDGKYFQVHLDGVPAYEARFDEVDLHSEGFHRVREGAKEYHIHSDGTPAYSQRFDQVTSFHKGRAMARLGVEWFPIIPNGARV